MNVRRILAAVLFFTALVGVGAGSLAIAASSERQVTEATLQELEHDEAHKSLTADAVKQARAAIERATRMRAAGDEAHALLADGLAHTWAETGKDLVRTADAEKQAATARRDATDAGARSERERALLEEGIAQNGRLRAQLEERAAKEAPTRTAAVGAALDGGAPRKGSGAGGRAAPAADAGSAPSPRLDGGSR